MAKLRNWVCYRDFKRAYTRFSKYRKLCYIRVRPANRISRYTGGTQLDYPIKIHLVTKSGLQIRDSALESARQSVNRRIEKVMGKVGYFLQMRVFPHHIVRENPLAAGAGADRLSTGMAHNYGKPIGIAARVQKGQAIFTIYTTKDRIPLARESLYSAAYKLPCQCQVIVEEKGEALAKRAAACRIANKKVSAKSESKKPAETSA